MTLTTHGTEYFRDPELVRQALRGVKVHQIDGGKFDVYAAGAVLFSIIENSFPAHGGLSQVSKNCPESLRWIIRRAMTDYDKRYPTARAMLDDLTVVAAASDPFTVKPADLPSMNGKAPANEPQQEPAPEPVFAQADVQAAASPVPPPAAHRDPDAAPAAGHAPNPAAFAAAPAAAIPKLRISDWWTGKYVPNDAASAPNPKPAARQNKAHAAAFNPRPQPRPRHEVQAERGNAARPVTPPEERLSAKDQLKNAKRRVAERRAHVGTAEARREYLSMGGAEKAGLAALGPTARSKGRYARRDRKKAPSAINAGIVLALLFVVSAIAATVAGVSFVSLQRAESAAVEANARAQAARDGELAILDAMGMDANPATPEPPMPPGIHAASIGNPAHGLVPAPGKELEDLGVAFLYDFRPPFDKETDGDLDKFDRVLEANDIRMSSNLIVEYADEIDDGDTMIAKLKQMRGMRPLDGALGEDISRYIEQTPGLDAVWWTGPADGHTKKNPRRRFLLVTGSAVSAFDSGEVTITDITSEFIGQAH
jgi:hypothetical protein